MVAMLVLGRCFRGYSNFGITIVSFSLNFPLVKEFEGVVGSTVVS